MSAVRDLGYKPYTGARLPASNNTKVLFRHAFAQAWSSVLVKIAVLLGWIPVVVLSVRYWLMFQAAEVLHTPAPSPGAELHLLVTVQLWGLCVLITLGGGAGVIASDAGQRAFQFYFAKPVTIEQYLGTRIGALATWCFAVLFGSGAMLYVIAVGLAHEPDRWDTAGVVLPLLLHCGLASVVLASCAVGVSALAKTPGTTLSAWLLLFVVPHVIAWTVHDIGEIDWLYLTSIPGMLGIVGSALFKETAAIEVPWYLALVVLVGGAVGAAAFARHRLGRAEVIV